jgi:hypothetical protein
MEGGRVGPRAGLDVLPLPESRTLTSRLFSQWSHKYSMSYRGPTFYFISPLIVCSTSQHDSTVIPMAHHTTKLFAFRVYMRSFPGSIPSVARFF